MNTQLRKKYDIEEQIITHFKQTYKKDFQDKLDVFVKEGFKKVTDELYTSKLHKI